MSFLYSRPHHSHDSCTLGVHQKFNLQSEVVHVGGTTILGVRDSLTVTVVAVIVAHHGQVVTCTISNMYCTADQPVNATSPAGSAP